MYMGSGIWPIQANKGSLSLANKSVVVYGSRTVGQRRWLAQAGWVSDRAAHFRSDRALVARED